MSSVDEVRAVLTMVSTDVQSAVEQAGTARSGIAEALAVLETLGMQSAEPLPPPQLRRAADELDRSIGLIHAGAGVVADIAARL